MDNSFFSIFRAIFGRNDLDHGRCLATNTLLGLCCFALGVLNFLHEVTRASQTSGMLLLAASLLLLAGMPVAHRRPGLAEAFLVTQGAVVLALGVAGLGSSIMTLRQAFESGERVYNTRYLPGVGAWLMIYGSLQIAAFGPWSKQPKWAVKAVAAGAAALEIYLLALIIQDTLRGP